MSESGVHGEASAAAETAAIGVVIVGVGFIAGAHIAAIASTPGVTLVGVVDADPARATAFSYSHGSIRWTAELAEALTWSDCDAVIICTPNFTHAALVQEVIAAGKHVLVEKPLATSVRDAAEMVAAAERRRVVLMAAHTHRFYDYGRTVRGLIADGELGRPVFGRLAILGDWIWPDWGAWMIDAAKSGGHALHNGVHLLDLMAWWFAAEPIAVRARGRKVASAELEIYDYLEMTMIFESGATAVCEMSRGHRVGGLGQRELLVVGTEGVLEQNWDEDGGLVISPDRAAVLPAQANDGFATQLAAWADAIGGGTPAMTAEEGLRAVRLGVAVEESIRSGHQIRLTDAAAVPAGDRGSVPARSDRA
ncbi:Gfo/Idh/MocA family protein [Microlunatus soli]|uniref:Predicted dehydrogenase n=1 Tax=Microlunatus soli TaxID=630515 RepID=A0A1H1R1L7_9ACTN|nr:Gfo/Idh/MocA family oxidoreductase [Microlunatus soli]SDS29684.1 Predicted dehydrogenase [Microlunatus soli]